MNLLFTLLGALPLGMAVRRRPVALLAYLVVDSFLFTFRDGRGSRRTTSDALPVG